MLHEICIQWAHQAQKFNSSKAGRKNSSQKSTNSLDIPSLSPLRLRQLFNFRVLNIRYLLKSAPPPPPTSYLQAQGEHGRHYFQMKLGRTFPLLPRGFKPCGPAGLCEIVENWFFQTCQTIIVGGHVGVNWLRKIERRIAWHQKFQQQYTFNSMGEWQSHENAQIMQACPKFQQ